MNGGGLRWLLNVNSGRKEKGQRGGKERMWVGVMVLTGKAQDDG